MSKEDKVKVTNLKNLPKFQTFEFWNNGQTDGRTDGRTDKVKPVYPPFNFVEAEGIKIPDLWADKSVNGDEIIYSSLILVEIIASYSDLPNFSQISQIIMKNLSSFRHMVKWFPERVTECVMKDMKKWSQNVSQKAKSKAKL